MTERDGRPDGADEGREPPVATGPQAGDATIWHNPRCSKSRQTKALLEELGVGFEVREYLKEPPTRAELEGLQAALGLDDPRAMVRTGEDAYKQLGLADAGADELLDAVVDNPILLQRPIVVRDGEAVIGRPPEDVRRLF